MPCQDVEVVQTKFPAPGKLLLKSIVFIPVDLSFCTAAISGTVADRCVVISLIFAVTDIQVSPGRKG